MNYPGADAEAPPPSASQLQAWAAAARPSFETVETGVPLAFAPSVAALRNALAAAAAGKPITPKHSAQVAANSVQHWGHENCGFTRLDVVDTGSAFAGIPAALPAGPVSVSFTNQTVAAKAGFVLLVTRPKPTANVSLEAVRRNQVDLSSVADVLAEVQPAGAGSTAYTSVQLPVGKYIIAAPIGSPPNFTSSLATSVAVH